MSSISHKTTVRKQDNHWYAINGAVIDFGPGPAGHRKALLAALLHDHPALGRAVKELAEQHDGRGQVVDRLLKAAQLVVKGAVKHRHTDALTGERFWTVNSQSTDKPYQVAFTGFPHRHVCDCHDFGFRDGVNTDYGPMCKHTLATVLADIAGVDITPQGEAIERLQKKTSAAGIGASISEMLGQDYRPDQPVRKWTKEQTDAAYKAAGRFQGDTGRYHGSARMNKLDF